jgi:hypothetical protein
MVKKVIPLLSAICMIPCIGINASADTIENNELNTINLEKDTVVYSAGLIERYSISLSSNGTALYLSGTTECSAIMKSVGFKNIVLQRSSNGTSWSDYKNIDDILNSSSSKCSISKKSLGTVPSGYYYRVTCKHYAKESGLFGSSESISNTSNSIKIS